MPQTLRRWISAGNGGPGGGMVVGLAHGQGDVDGTIGPTHAEAVAGEKLEIRAVPDPDRKIDLGVSPLTLGHEIAGFVEATGPGVTRVHEGDPVLVEPTLRCLHKGLPDCARCAAGEGHLCERIDLAGDLCVGQGIGFSDVLGGGWSEGLLAHESMLVPADGIAADRAVLAEPASVALHAALRWDRTGDAVVVIGPGTVGLLVTAALRMLHPDLDITVPTRASMIACCGPRTRLPDARSRAELAGAARPLRRRQGRRDPDAATRGRTS